MTVGNEDVSVRRRDYVGWQVEVASVETGLARHAKGQQDLAPGTELDDVMPFVGGSALRERKRGVRHPDVTLAVNVHAVGCCEQSTAEAPYHHPVGVELEDNG